MPRLLAATPHSYLRDILTKPFPAAHEGADQESVASLALINGIAAVPRDRLPWLLVGLMGSVLATFVMTRFEHTLQSQVVIAFFVPGLVYLADAIGTQTEAIAVRGLSLSHAPPRHLDGLRIAGWFDHRPYPRRTDLPGRLAHIRRRPLGIGGFTGVSYGRVRRHKHRFSVSVDILPFGQRSCLRQSGPLATIFQNLLTLIVYYVTVSLIVL
jgi:magnesium transporter